MFFFKTSLMKCGAFLFSCICFLVNVGGFGQIVINEYSASNLSTTTDNYGEYEDWMELYNTTANAINLTGYYLSDNKNKPSKWAIPSGSIPANGRIVVWCSGLDEVNGSNFHSSFKLTQTKAEELLVSDPLGNILDSISIIPAQLGHSRGRTSDGAATWGVFVNPTPGSANSNAMQEYATTPQFSLVPGFYTVTQTLTITSPDANVTVHYTTNGSTPTSSSPIASGSITINTTQVVRAMAFSSDPNIPTSFIETNTYYINSPHSIPVVSISGDNIETLLNGNQINPYGTFEYFDKSGLMVTEATGDFNKHGNDSWAYDQRGLDYITRDQYGYNHALQHKIFSTKKRKKFQRIILKAGANDNYPFENGGAHMRDGYVHHLSQLGKLKLDERSYEPCILYVNGQYWGVYESREKVDDPDFTDYYYDQDKEDLQYLKTWGGTWSEYGGIQAQTDWDNLRNFITTNNMAVQSNYDYVDSLFNTGSLVDYFVLNSYVVTMDWLNWNTAWWRGRNPNGDKKKWRYTLWDLDAIFGHYINYTGIPDISAQANPCNPDSLPDPGGQGHTEILNALMDNAGFKQYYISRFIDLSNTVFKCDNMLALLDSMVALIEPEMQQHTTRWGGSYSDWQANVQTLRDFITDRCNAFNQGMIDCYTLSGPYDLMFDVYPVNSGNIDVNSLNVTQFTWAASYFGGIDIQLDADADSGWTFDHWGLKNHAVSPDSMQEQVILSITASDTIIAYFIPDTATTTDTTSIPPDTTTTDTTTNDTTTVEPIIEPDKEFFMPNAFSPNSDNFNDVLRVYGNKIKEMHLMIYNRWGQVVFESKDQNLGWDGTHNGKPLNSGVFAYYLRVTLTTGELIEKSGNISLMR
ncbi:MAG: hypothetical protein COA57_14685 [Flavobacteriales bacterium]|nr:MAG: hypothetical protein COA57_14685 [Flavobacteriales bacterium]